MFRSMLTLVLASLWLLFLVNPASATCLAYPPPLKKGASCNVGTTICQQGLYCDVNGLCAEQVAENQPCISQDACTFGTYCRGPEGKTLCAKIVKPGDTCDPAQEGTGPYCPYVCNPTSKICTYGVSGDACTGSDPMVCAGSGLDKCVNGLCAPLEDGAECVNSYQCKVSSFCDTGASKCRPKKTSGVCSDGDCAFGYTCSEATINDIASCTLDNSRKAGEGCDADANCDGAARCNNRICSSKKLTYCNSGNQCGQGESCNCGGLGLFAGVGTCSITSCDKKTRKYQECVALNCVNTGLNTVTQVFPFSCPSQFCADEFNALCPVFELP